MRVIHLLRKYDPAEWGGTETAVQRLFHGLRQHNVSPVMYCPQLNGYVDESDHDIKRFRACIPSWGISPQEKKQLTALGGNLMSFDLLPALWHERDISVIHTHTLGRLGGIASAVARARRVPFVVSIHGGLLDMPRSLSNELNKSSGHGFEWGKIFGLLLQSRRLISHADAVLTCNPSEAELLRAENPGKRVEVQPHGIPVGEYQKDHRAAAREAFPQIQNRDVLLCAGRIDPVKNQQWLIAQAPEMFRKHPRLLLVLAGACTDPEYGKSLDRQIAYLGLAHRVLLTGGLPSGDARLVGLFQEARAVLLSSISETFGLVLLEAWAAGTTVISSRTSGASALIRDGENGWLFDLARPREFHQALDQTLFNPALQAQLAQAGHRLVNAQYDLTAIAGQVKRLYQELIEEKHAPCDSAR